MLVIVCFCGALNYCQTSPVLATLKSEKRRNLLVQCHDWSQDSIGCGVYSCFWVRIRKYRLFPQVFHSWHSISRRHELKVKQFKMLKHCRSEAVLICLRYIVIIKITELFRLERISMIKAKNPFPSLLSCHCTYLVTCLTCWFVHWFC